MLQIEDRANEFNPHYHTPQDNIAHMNLDYWEEQIKASVATVAHLAVPAGEKKKAYLPLVIGSPGWWD